MNARRGVRAVTCALVLSLAGAAASAQVDDDVGRTRYRRGVELYQSGQFAPALDEFRASLARLESPNTLLFLARTLRELGRPAEAVAAFERAVGEAHDRAAHDARYAPTEDVARQELSALASRVGHVRIALRGAVDGARVTVGGRALPPGGLELPIVVAPGAVDVIARTPAGLEVRSTVQIAAGAEATVALVLPAIHAGTTAPTPHPAHTPALRTLGVAGVLAGAVSLLTGGVALGLAAAQYDALGRACMGQPCDPSRLGDVHAGRAEQWTGDVALGVGAGLVLLGGVAWWLGRARPPVGVRAIAPGAAAGLRF